MLACFLYCFYVLVVWVHIWLHLSLTSEFLIGCCPARNTVITYNTVILGLCKAHRINTGINILKEMMVKGCQPNETMYILLLEGIASAGHRAEAMELARKLAASDFFLEDSIK